MAPIAGRPFLEYLLDRLGDSEITSVILSVGYKSEFIRSHFGNRYRHLGLCYSEEDMPLGTGGAIAQAIENQDCENLIVLNGDTFIDIVFQDYINWHRSKSAEISMVLKTMDDVARYGSVQVDRGRVVGYDEKGKKGAGHINAGVYIFKPSLFTGRGMPTVFSFEQDFLQPKVNDLMPHAYICDNWFIDIGVPEDYDRAQTALPSVFEPA